MKFTLMFMCEGQAGEVETEVGKQLYEGLNMFPSWTDTVKHGLAAVHDFQKLPDGPCVSVVLEYTIWSDAFVYEAEHMAIDQWQYVLCVCKLLGIL